MKIEQKMLTPGETAAILGKRLGYGRDWYNTLRDWWVGRRHDMLGVAPLLPYGRAGHRPLYRLCEIRAFIAAVKASPKDAALVAGAMGAPFSFDDAIGLPWRMRKMNPAAGPASF